MPVKWSHKWLDGLWGIHPIHYIYFKPLFKKKKSPKCYSTKVTHGSPVYSEARGILALNNMYTWLLPHIFSVRLESWLSTNEHYAKSGWKTCINMGRVSHISSNNNGRVFGNRLLGAACKTPVPLPPSNMNSRKCKMWKTEWGTIPTLCFVNQSSHVCIFHG